MNLRSLTDAIGWRGIFSMFAGKDSDPQPLNSFLPFPDEFGDSKPRLLSTATTEILKQLIRESRLSDKVVAAAINLDASLADSIPELPLLPTLPVEMLL